MKNKNTLRRIALIGAGIVGAVIMSYGIVVVLFSHEMTTIPVHHLLHAGMAVGAGMLAMALASLLPPQNRERSGWVIPTVVAPAVGLLLMWPSEYAYLMGHPWLHVLDHAGIALCSLLAVFAAQAYVRALGWPMLVLLVGMDAAAAGGFGVSPGPSELLSPQASVAVTENAGTNPAQAASLHLLGRQLAQSLGCTACHKIDGTKGVGPTWKHLAGYPQKLANGTTEVADYQFLKNAILYPEHLHLEGFPAGAMPTSYRAMLSGPQHTNEHQLNALIWYINTLSDRSSSASQPPVPDKIAK
ncbi:MAG TPA: c-type cytochrome [Verrucomicrobiae bacterium]|nr:c-type cytochrome [Verrucomicrobiae bacterium]